MANITRKQRFTIPPGTIYLDGNSLGPLPNGVSERVQNMLHDEWGQHLIKGWNVDNWMEQPVSVANRLGKLIGAPAESVVLGDTLSLKVYQALSSALALRSERKVILSDTGNFPTDLYMAEGLIKQLGTGHQLQLVEPDDVINAINDNVAALLLTQVDYRTGRMHDMVTVTKAAQDAGVITIWDLAHSAGAVPVNVFACQAEFAVGCTYKYLNGGPGAPAFIYVKPDLIEQITPTLSGWLGHDSPFAFELKYRPASGIERMRIGTPPVIQIAALDAALDVFDDINMQELREASIDLCELFIKNVEQRCHDLLLASPRDPHCRGSQVSFSFKHGYAAMQALIAQGVIGDFRAPDIMRFGFTPLYIDEHDVLAAIDILVRVIEERLWDKPEYQIRSRVT